MAMVDTDLRYLAVSARWRTDHGLVGTDVVGRRHDELFPSPPARWGEAYGRCLAGAIEEAEADAVTRPDGSRRWLRWQVRPWYTGAGSVGGLVVATEDITARKEAEAALASSEGRLRLALEASDAGIWTWRVATDELICDARACEMYGCVPGEPHTFEAWTRRLHPDDRGRVLARIGCVLNTPGDDSWRAEFRVVQPDGTTVWIEGLGGATRDASGGVEQLAGISLDVTARKQAEAALRASHLVLESQTRELHHRDRQVRRLVSDVTLAEQHARERVARVLHDHVQQLLFSAAMKLDRLAPSADGWPAAAHTLLFSAREQLSEAMRATRTLSVELFPAVLRDSLLPEALAWLAEWMRQKHGLAVDLQAQPDADPGRPDLRVLVFECVRELLFNVVKHAHTGRAVITAVKEDALVVTVADDGPGLDPAEVLGRSAATARGFGLMALEQRLRLLGGRLHVTSALGRGTRCEIVVPRGAGPPEARLADDTPAAGEDGRAVQAPAPPLRILVADDHALVRDGLRELLQDHPEFEIAGEAANGLDALALARALHPHVVLMDVSMPELDGVAATRRLRVELPDVEVLGLSTQEQGDGLHAIEEAGATGYFTKGDDAQRLVERLKRVRAARFGHEG
jgi:PAS domain S-box-containing protein